jgi:predicted RNA-binding Zn ribbon-like protein
MSTIRQIDDVADDQLLLDLLNSTPTIEGAATDELAESSTARAWMRAHGGRVTLRERERLREVRGVLQSVVRGRRTAKALAPFVHEINYRPVATDDGLAWTLEVADDEVLATRALLAWDRLRRTAPGRLRPCANDECSRFLLDRSKANTARWCSMAVCGNRMKARRHYQRRREARD